MYQVVEHSLKFLDFVAIGSQAVLSLCSSESPGGISRLGVECKGIPALTLFDSKFPRHTQRKIKVTVIDIRLDQ